jgi:MazG family protein
VEHSLQVLIEVLQRLRGPGGCPWDRQQTLSSAARFLQDEVVEYVEAAAEGDARELTEELADLLYMVCFNWLLLSEETGVSLEDLAAMGAQKLIRRKPHVFGDETAATSSEAQVIWKREKAKEKQNRGKGGRERAGALKHLAASASSLRQALVFGVSAAETGFDWQDHREVLSKLKEETAELEEALEEGQEARVRDEMGDIPFAATQLARKLDLDPESCLSGTNRKFACRFGEMEARCANQSRKIGDLSRDEMFRYWEESKTNDHKD